jgi:hypothetical protein
MSGLMMAKAASLGLAGKNIKDLFDAISFGICNTVMTASVQGIIIGAGIGTGTGTITGLVNTALENTIYGMELAQTLSGSKMRDLISAIAFGVCTHIMTATVTLTDVGAAAGPPVGPVTIPAAPGIGRIV